MVARGALKYRIALTIFLLEGVMMAVVLWQVLGAMTESVSRQLAAQERVVLALLLQVSRTALLTEDYGELQFHFRQARGDPHVSNVLLADPAGRVVASARLEDLGKPMPATRPVEASSWRLETIANAAGPLGVLAVEFSTQELRQAQAHARNLGLVIATLGMTVIAVVGLALGHLLTRRLDRLTQAARHMADGDLNARSRLAGRDEVAEVGRAFDTMAERLGQEREALRRANATLESRVAERTAALASANDELQAFAYSVSHDLRGPLRGVDGFAQILLEDYGDRLDDTGREHLRRVRAGTQRMGELIDDLLKLSRVTRVPLRPETLDLSGMARDILAHLRDAQPERQVEANLAEGLRAQGDAGLMRVVVENLLGNAWKYTAKQPQAHIEFGRQGENGKTVFFVRDNGAGFDMRHADKLFGAFQRLHHASEFEGSGIGLATVQRIIQRHGGRIWAEGEPGRGAIFYFTLGQPGHGSEVEEGTA